jgi:acetolactate synthase-1/2/3 large subunit
MLFAEASAVDPRRYQATEAHPGSDDMLRLQKLLGQAKSPLVMLGGSGWTKEACADMERFAVANHLPVTCAFRYQDLLDNRHDHYVGDVGIGINPVLAERVRMSDLLMVFGPRLGEMTTSGYTLIEAPVPRQKLVHVHAGAEEIGRVYQPELGIVSGPAPFARAAAALAPVENPPWKGAVAEARADYLAWSARREIPSISSTRRPPRRSTATAPATSPPGCIASTAMRAGARSSRRPPAPWATACPRRSPPSWCIPSAP